MTEFVNISKKYGDKVVFDNFSLSVPEEKISVIMGESGKGKTTLLSIAAGIVNPDRGKFVHSGNISYMFQEPRLFSWFTVSRNIEAVLPSDKKHLSRKYLSFIGMEEDSGKYPRELSGGMKQRVSFARFLAYTEATDANLLLLDEPFSSIDENMTAAMIEILKNSAKNKTVLYVTHNSNEAGLVGDNIIEL